ncbi:PaaI family thioesterase [soil metagenome]
MRDQISPDTSANASPLPDKQEVLRQWLARETEMRARMAEPGIISLEKMKSMSGFEFLQGILNGELPVAHIGKTMDFFPVEGEPGRIVFQGTPGRQHYNPLGSVHGGYFCTLLDSAVGCAVQSMLPRGVGYTTLEIKVNLIRALTDKTGPVRAEGKVIQVGRQVGTAEGRIVDASGKVYAHATTTCLVFPLP